MTSPHTGRIIIRANQIFLDSHNDIVKEWAEFCGASYGNDDDKNDWHKKNFFRVAGIDQHRMHVIIDMGKDDTNPHDSDCVPLTVYRYTRDSQGKGTFRLLDPKKQAGLYDIYRMFTRTFAWGRD